MWEYFCRMTAERSWLALAQRAVWYIVATNRLAISGFFFTQSARANQPPSMIPFPIASKHLAKNRASPLEIAADRNGSGITAPATVPRASAWPVSEAGSSVILTLATSAPFFASHARIDRCVGSLYPFTLIVFASKSLAVRSGLSLATQKPIVGAAELYMFPAAM